MICQTFTHGVVQALRNKKLLFTLFAVNLLFALLLTLPLRSSFNTSLSRSLVSGFDSKFLFWFLREYRHVIDSMVPLLLFVGIIYLLTSAFLTGGVIDIFSSTTDFQEQAPEGFTLARFFNGCGRLFPRYVRLLLISGIFWFSLIGLYSLLKMIKIAPEGSLLEESLPFWLGIGRLVLVGFIALLGNMILDYAKIIAAIEEKRKMLRVTWEAVKFVFGNLGKTLGLYYLIFLVGTFLLSGYVLINRAIRPNSGFWIFVLFLIQQLYILSKLWVRMSFYSGQILLFKQLR